MTACERARLWIIRLATLSAILTCIATCAMWIRSYHRGDSLWWLARRGDPGEMILFVSSFGRLQLEVYPSYETERIFWYTPKKPRDLIQFHYAAETRTWHRFTLEKGPGVFGVVVPHWFLAGATASMGLLSFCLRRRWRTRRVPPGCCSTCGYDLRAHSPGQKCPKCGTEIPQPGAPPRSTPSTS